MGKLHSSKLHYPHHYYTAGSQSCDGINLRYVALVFVFVQQPAGCAGRAGGPGSLHLPSHQPEVCLPRGRGPLAAAGEQHQQVSEGRISHLSEFELSYNATLCVPE